jgi:gluconolactonase
MKRASILVVLALIVGVAHAETVIDDDARYPEGPLWRDGALFVAEMGADAVSVYVDGRKRTYWRDPGCGPTSLAPYGDGLLVLCHMGRVIVALDPKGAEVRRWRAADDGVRLRNPNDSFADGRGGVYFSDPGAFAKGARPQGAILHLSASGALKRVAEGLRYPNGVFVDAGAGRLLASEHLARRVLSFQIEADGALTNSTVFADISAISPQQGDYAEAGPDGIERAPNGDVYVCLYGEGRILRLASDGSLRTSIPVSTRYVTNIAFAVDGSAAVTGAHDNMTPPFPGRVTRLAPAVLGTAPQSR